MPQPTKLLSRDWNTELERTVKPAALPKAAQLVAKALDAYLAGEFSRAASLAGEAKRDAPRSGRLRELLGLSLYHSGRWQEAIRELLTFRRMTGTVDQNHIIADCYRAAGRPEKAVEACLEVSQAQVPSEIWSELVIVAASAMGEMNDFERALNHLGRAELEPKQVQEHHLRLWYVRADLLERAGRAAEARNLFKRIAEENPDFYDAAERLRKAAPPS